MSNIYWPLLAQLLIPLLIMLLNGKRKAADVKAGTVDLEKAAMDNEAWSKPVILTSKNLANQFQFPVLFYVLCLILAQIGAVTTAVIVTAWLFVLSRYIHAYTHVTSNYIPVRMNVFIFGLLMLTILFGLTIAAVARL